VTDCFEIWHAGTLWVIGDRAIIVEIHFRSNRRWRTASTFQSLNRYDSAISLKFGTEFDHVAADTLQTFKVKWSKISVTA